MAKEDKKKEEKAKDSPETPDPDETPSRQNDQAKEPGLDQLKELLAVEKDRVLRLSAEFDNYKKRKQREIEEFRKFANEDVFKKILPVVDNFERAITSAETHTEESGLLEGVKMIHKEIVRLFESFNVRMVNAQNEPFDPNFHQAVTRQESDEFPENTVLTVLQNGYLLHDRLIRPAMVVVSKKTETEKNLEN